ncbi:MAG TPA: hypothetical protein VEC38_14610 [Candidatus Binataceae bacterium]|nr:hypothetical protein [Candidatus Binataceae bacterium]
MPPKRFTLGFAPITSVQLKRREVALQAEPKARSNRGTFSKSRYRPRSARRKLRDRCPLGYPVGGGNVAVLRGIPENSTRARKLSARSSQ